MIIKFVPNKSLKDKKLNREKALTVQGYHILVLPIELINRILHFLPSKDIQTVLKTSKSLQKKLQGWFHILYDDTSYESYCLSQTFSYNVFTNLCAASEKNYGITRYTGTFLIDLRVFDKFSANGIIKFLREGASSWSKSLLTLKCCWNDLYINSLMAKELFEISAERGNIKQLEISKRNSKFMFFDIPLIDFSIICLKDIDHLIIDSCRYKNLLGETTAKKEEIVGSLKSLKLNGRWVMDALKAIELPEHTIIENNRTYYVPQEPDMRSEFICVENLTPTKLFKLSVINSSIDGIKNCSFPVLEQLSISDSFLRSIQNISSPNLVELKIDTKKDNGLLLLKNLDLPKVKNIKIYCDSLCSDSSDMNCTSLRELSMTTSEQDLNFQVQFKRLFKDVEKVKENLCELSLRSPNVKFTPDFNFKNLRSLSIDTLTFDLHRLGDKLDELPLLENFYFNMNIPSRPAPYPFYEEVEFPDLTNTSLTALGLHLPLRRLDQSNFTRFTNLKYLYLKGVKSPVITSLALPNLKILDIRVAGYSPPVMKDCQFLNLTILKLSNDARKHSRLNSTGCIGFDVYAPRLEELFIPNVVIEEEFDISKYIKLKVLEAPKSKEIIISEVNSELRELCLYKSQVKKLYLGKLPKLNKLTLPPGHLSALDKYLGISMLTVKDGISHCDHSQRCLEESSRIKRMTVGLIDLDLGIWPEIS